MPKAGQRKDDGVVIVLLTEDCDEKEVRALCHRVGGELGNVVMEWLRQPAAMRKTDKRLPAEFLQHRRSQSGSGRAVAGDAAMRGLRLNVERRQVLQLLAS